MDLLKGKRGIILGVANERSLAWGIAEKFIQEGAEVAFTYLGDAQKKRVENLLGESSAPLFPCDVSIDEDIENLAKGLEKTWPSIDFIIHSVAFTFRECLKEPFLKTSREHFMKTLDISSYSLIAVTRALSPLLNQGGSVLSLSYYGSQKVIPHYNVMGVAKSALEAITRYLAYDLGERQIKVNCISAGAIKTLSSSAIPGLSQMVESDKHPLRKSLSKEDVANSATFLVSDLNSAITGETIYVDCGANIMGYHVS